MSCSRGENETMDQYKVRMKATFLGIDHRLKGRLLYFAASTKAEYEGAYRYVITAAYRKNR
jgi:hypothetical protein